jgi:hypothetical protein
MVARREEEWEERSKAKREEEWEEVSLQTMVEASMRGRPKEKSGRAGWEAMVVVRPEERSRAMMAWEEPLKERQTMVWLETAGVDSSAGEVAMGRSWWEERSKAKISWGQEGQPCSQTTRESERLGLR